jgi:poly(3-hydroxybutyrate) depolymerase
VDKKFLSRQELDDYRSRNNTDIRNYGKDHYSSDHVGEVTSLLDHIDALERQVEAAFREGYSAGYSAGNAAIMNTDVDKTDCWNLSSSKAAIASAQDENNG